MSPKPPLLHLPPTQSEKWWRHALAQRPKTPLVNGSAVIASLSVSFAFVIGVIAWILAHPNDPPHATIPAPALAAAVPSPVVAREPRVQTPVSHSPSPTPATPAVHPPNRRDMLIKGVPLTDDAPPLLPPPAQPRQADGSVAAKAPPPPAGETYGTQVLFLNNPEMAAEMARRDKKLLFILHISGNFEDSCFT